MQERLKYAPCGYISISQEGYITQVNQTFLNWMGYKETDLLNNHFEILLSVANKLMFHSYFYPNINLNENVEELFIKFKDYDGNSVPFLLNGRRFHHNGVEIIDCILVKMKKRIDYEEELRTTKKQLEEAYWQKDQALSKLEQLHKEIEEKQAKLLEINGRLVELSNTDKLTGLNNRRVFQEKLEEQIQTYYQTSTPFSLFLIDIDHFKKINDTYGHQTGDAVLENLATILKNYARPKDIVARFGGEEFAIILPNTESNESIKIAEYLRKTIINATWDEIKSLTVSIGIATFTAVDSEKSIIRNADIALYASKENGRNRSTHIFDLEVKK